MKHLIVLVALFTAIVAAAGHDRSVHFDRSREPSLRDLDQRDYLFRGLERSTALEQNHLNSHKEEEENSIHKAFDKLSIKTDKGKGRAFEPIDDLVHADAASSEEERARKTSRQYPPSRRKEVSPGEAGPSRRRHREDSANYRRYDPSPARSSSSSQSAEFVTLPLHQPSSHYYQQDSDTQFIHESYIDMAKEMILKSLMRNPLPVHSV